MPRLDALLALDEPAFRQMFAGGPVRRAGHARFLRNVLVAAGNSGEAALVPAVEALLAHDSPLVRGMAVWALRRLLDEDVFDEARKLSLSTESDPDVLAEWT
jgi:epoxyqueuosine reductase